MTFTQSAARLAGLTCALFHWRPHEFWDATPAELAGIFAALTQPYAATAPPSSAEITQLMEMYPDGSNC